MIKGITKDVATTNPANPPRQPDAALSKRVPGCWASRANPTAARTGHNASVGASSLA